MLAGDKQDHRSLLQMTVGQRVELWAYAHSICYQQFGGGCGARRLVWNTETEETQFTMIKEMLYCKEVAKALQQGKRASCCSQVTLLTTDK